jgi:hypothetical protein
MKKQFKGAFSLNCFFCFMPVPPMRKGISAQCFKMPLNFKIRIKLLFFYIFCGRSSIAYFDLEGNMVSFGQGPKSWHIDRGMVHKYVVTFFLLDKAISFSVAKPFYDSVRQNVILLFSE